MSSQITVYGEYGRMERRVFMGVSQIVLSHLDLSTMVIGWYKLYTQASLAVSHGLTTSTSGGFPPSSSNSRRNSESSIDMTFASISGSKS